MKKFLFVTIFLLLTNLLGAQVVVMHFNAGWNSTNDVEWIEELDEVEIEFIDIAKKPKLQQKYKIVVVPTIVVFNHGEEVKRFQANIMMNMEAKLEDIQTIVDDIVMESF